MKTIITILSLMLASWGVSAQWEQTNGPPGGDYLITSFLPFGDNVLVGTYEIGMYLSNDRGMTWRRVATEISSVSEFVAIGKYILVGTYNNGVFRSEDNGETWVAINNGLNGIPDVMTLTVSKGKIFLATCKKLYLSENEGESWTPISNFSPGSACMRSVVISGNALFAAYQDDGVYRSTNNGVSWIEVNAGLSNQIVGHMAVNGDHIFAGTSEGGVFLSTNNGNTWTAANNGLTGLWILSIVVSEPYVFVATAGWGVFRSDNNGASWTAINSGMPDPDPDYGNVNITALGVDGPNLFAGFTDFQTDAIYSSVNSGSSWTKVSGLPFIGTSITSLAVSGSTLFAGTNEDGLFKSFDNGETWESLAGSLRGTVYTFFVDGTRIFAGQWGEIRVSTNNGDSWKSISKGLPEDERITSIVAEGNNLFARNYASILFRSTDNGASWHQISIGVPDAYVGSLAIIGKHIFISTSAGVFLSTDNGNSWTAVNNGLTTLLISSFIVSGTTLFVGTFPNGVFQSTDFGGSWVPVNNIDLANSYITRFAVNGTNIVAFGSDLFYSRNGGDSWSKDARPHFPDGLETICLAISGTNVFAGTDGGGVFRNSFILSEVHDDFLNATFIRVYPNPASNCISIEVPDLTNDAHLSIFNTNGQKVLDYPVTELQTTIDISHLPAGAYILRYTDGMTTEVGRLIKE